MVSIYTDILLIMKDSYIGSLYRRSSSIEDATSCQLNTPSLRSEKSSPNSLSMIFRRTCLRDKQMKISIGSAEVKEKNVP